MSVDSTVHEELVAMKEGLPLVAAFGWTSSYALAFKSNSKKVVVLFEDLYQYCCVFIMSCVNTRICSGWESVGL